MYFVCFVVYVVMFLGKKVYFKIQDNKDGIVIVRYQFIEIGFYEFYVKYNNDDIEGEKRKFIVGIFSSFIGGFSGLFIVCGCLEQVDLVVCVLCVDVICIFNKKGNFIEFLRSKYDVLYECCKRY